ncbi:MAG TPA: hypothetical protein VGI97_12430 [Gemmatimonadaceae bacterium]
MSSAARARRGATWAPIAACAIVGAIALAAITAVPVGVFWDDGVYLIAAKSLATGMGYRFLDLPGAPAAVHYPPGWPALLAVICKLSPAFPDNVVLLKLVNPLLLALGAGLACMYAVRRLHVPPLAAMASAVVFAAALPEIVISGVLFSEPFFFVVLMGALVLADHAVDHGGWKAALAAGVAAGAVALVRSVGVALIPALVLALLVARRRREAAVAIGGAVAALAPWQLWIARHAHDLPVAYRGNYGPYLDWVLGMYRDRGAAFALVIARTNVLTLMRSFGIALFPFGPREIRPLLVTLMLVVTAVAVIRARRRATTALLFVFFYCALVFAWPYSPERFMWGIWPLLGVLLASGAIECWRIACERGAARGVKVTAMFACAVGIWAIGGHAAYSVRGASRHWWDSAARANADALLPVVDWIKTNTNPADVIAVDGEPFVYLHTGRTVVPVHDLAPEDYFGGTPVERDADHLRALIVTGRARYVVFSRAAERDIAPFLDGANGTPKLERIASIAGGGTAYRVVSGP